MPERRTHHAGGAAHGGLRMTTFNLPDLGEGLQEAEIVAWHVAEGDHVVADQPLLAVETEKAVVEIPSPHAGHIARLLVRPGERVKSARRCSSSKRGSHPEAAPSWALCPMRDSRPGGGQRAGTVHAAGGNGGYVRRQPSVRAPANSVLIWRR